MRLIESSTGGSGRLPIAAPATAAAMAIDRGFHAARLFRRSPFCRTIIRQLGKDFSMRFGAVLAFAFLVTARAFAAETDQQRVDRIFAEYNRADSPGCALGVIRDGEFIYRKGYGTASLELAVPLSSGSVFNMGSVSKQFTAASLVLAAEQGYLSLDDNIRKYIPELPDYGQPITLREMLHHTSGFRDIAGLLKLSGRNLLDVHPTAELMDLIARQEALNFIPGAEYQYSNTNYFLLAEVVKRATRKPLAVFAAENIFQPLGMTHTRFDDDHTVVIPGRIPAYAPGEKGSFLVAWSTNYDIVGAGGLMSSVDDLLLWDRNFYENRLGKGTLLKEMLTPGVLNGGKQISYALGLEIETYRGLPIVEHGGDRFGYHTDILRFPEQRFTVLCLCNLSGTNPTRLSRKVADIYLEKSLQPAAGPPKPQNSGVSNPGSFAGEYLNSVDHSTVSFADSGGVLAIVNGASLQSIGPNRFRTPRGSIIAFDSSNNMMRVTIDTPDEPLFAGAKIERVHVGDADLAAYAGTYTSKELDATYKLSVEDGNLMLRNNWNPARKLVPLVRDEFDGGDYGTLVFHRNSGNRISGLSVFESRVRNLTFEKIN
jgi:CubicO group peptidase (beta-lactamase class C family)